MLSPTYLCTCPVCFDDVVVALLLLKTEYNAMLSLTYLCTCLVCFDVVALLLLKTEYTCLDAVLSEQKHMLFVVSYLKLTYLDVCVCVKPAWTL